MPAAGPDVMLDAGRIVVGTRETFRSGQSAEGSRREAAHSTGKAGTRDSWISLG